jgi:hypothetical protein
LRNWRIQANVKKKMVEKVQREVEDAKTNLQEKAENLDAMSVILCNNEQ